PGQVPGVPHPPVPPHGRRPDERIGRLSGMTGETQWVRIASKAEIAEGSVQGVPFGEGFVAVYHLQGGAVCATSDICTHEYARLSEGWLEGGTVVCPLHGGRFDVQTGA